MPFIHLPIAMSAVMRVLPGLSKMRKCPYNHGAIENDMIITPKWGAKLIEYG